LPTRPEHLGRHYDKRSIRNFGVHFGIGCEYRISYRVGVGVGVSYTFYADSRASKAPPAPGRASTAAGGFISKKISENSKIC